MYLACKSDFVTLGKRRTKSTGDLSRDKRTIVPLNEDSEKSDNSQSYSSSIMKKKSYVKTKGKVRDSKVAYWFYFPSSVIEIIMHIYAKFFRR